MLVTQAGDNRLGIPVVVLRGVTNPGASPVQTDRGLGVVLLVNVGRSAATHHDLGALVQGRVLSGGGVTHPVLHGVARFQVSAGVLIPTNGVLAQVTHNSANPVKELVVNRSAVTRGHRVRLIATHVQVGAGGDGRQLAQYVFYEGKGHFRVGVQVGVANRAGAVSGGGGLSGGGLVGGASRVQLRDCVQGGVGVTRQVNFGHQGDVAGGGVGHNFLVLCLGVVAGVAHLIGLSLVVHVHGGAARNAG